MIDNNLLLNPFLGLKRKRLPGMHMITACEGGAPLENSLGALFFMLLHDKYAHRCLTKEAFGEHITYADSYAFEEWSYLEDDDASTILLIAGMATEQVQRWIAEGSHEPFKIPTLGGEIVIRPDWAIRYFGSPHTNSNRRESRIHVNRLLLELEKDNKK